MNQLPAATSQERVEKTRHLRAHECAQHHAAVLLGYLEHLTAHARLAPHGLLNVLALAEFLMGLQFSDLQGRHFIPREICLGHRLITLVPITISKQKLSRGGASKIQEGRSDEEVLAH